MSYNNQAETRFIELMGELFQLDEAEALDFGLYRIIRRHNREVREFLGEIVTAGERKTLQGGRLSALLDETFAALDAEAAADELDSAIALEKEAGQSRYLGIYSCLSITYKYSRVNMLIITY